MAYVRRRSPNDQYLYRTKERHWKVADKKSSIADGRGAISSALPCDSPVADGVGWLVVENRKFVPDNSLVMSTPTIPVRVRVQGHQGNKQRYMGEYSFDGRYVNDAPLYEHTERVDDESSEAVRLSVQRKVDSGAISAAEAEALLQAHTRKAEIEAKAEATSEAGLAAAMAEKQEEGGRPLALLYRAGNGCWKVIDKADKMHENRGGIVSSRPAPSPTDPGLSYKYVRGQALHDDPDLTISVVEHQLSTKPFRVKSGVPGAGVIGKHWTHSSCFHSAAGRGVIQVAAHERCVLVQCTIHKNLHSKKEATPLIIRLRRQQLVMMAPE